MCDVSVYLLTAVYHIDSLYLMIKQTEVKVYYSRLGNNQFILMLFEFSRMPVCELQNKDIFVNTRHSLHNCSNLPIPDDPNVKSCDMPPLVIFFQNHFNILSLKMVLLFRDTTIYATVCSKIHQYFQTECQREDLDSFGIFIKEQETKYFRQ